MIQPDTQRLAVQYSIAGLVVVASLLLPGFAGAAAGPAERPLLDPSKIPPVFKTGRYRSARWDGGPIEAEKGRLSGWPNFLTEDPRQVMEATRDWYNPRTIEFLKTAHINWAWVTWSVGFSPASEKEQWDLVSRYIELCHKNDIRVAAYFSIGNMFWKDMFEKMPESIAWVERLEDGSPLFYSRPHRYMAEISHPGWMRLQRQRVEAAARAGTDAFWIDNTFSYYGEEKVAKFLDDVYEVTSRINPRIVIMSNYNRGVLTWGRLQNGVTTEDGEEPGYFADQAGEPLVTNAGLLRHAYAIGEGWRPVSVEFGGRHNGDSTGTSRMTRPMAPRRWQLAIAECAMYGVSLEPYFEGLFLRDLYFGEARAIEGLKAIGVYNSFLERHEDYYTEPQSLARVAVLAGTTDEILPYLNRLSRENLNYDVLFNYQLPPPPQLQQYRVVVLPNTNPLSADWGEALGKWVEEGGTLMAIQDASIFAPGTAAPDHEMILGPILGISRRTLPTEIHRRPRGKGIAIYLPQLPPAKDLARLIREHVGNSEVMDIETRPAILSNIVRQPDKKRIVLHLLNYQQNLEKDVMIRVRRPVAKVEVFSPDAISSRQASVRKHQGGSEIIVPELRTYDLIAIYGDSR
jgi:hypothetical protein